MHLEKKRETAKRQELGRKRKALSDELSGPQKNRKTAEETATQLVAEADKLCFKAQEVRSFSLIKRANCLRLRSKTKKSKLGPENFGCAGKNETSFKPFPDGSLCVCVCVTSVHKNIVL